MDRSEINEIIYESNAFIRSFGCQLPPFAYWTPATLQERVQKDSVIIRDHALGWDITDYGKGNFRDIGLFLFTVRNGSRQNIESGKGMLYAEKIMISHENQISPMHRHNFKTEDIINKGGGVLVVELFKATPEREIDQVSEVTVCTDGTVRRLPAGCHLKLSPGESVTLEPDCWHAFWGEGGSVLIGEVSNVNDDRTDNIFRDSLGRFSEINENAEPSHLLVSDYDIWLKGYEND